MDAIIEELSRSLRAMRNICSVPVLLLPSVKSYMKLFGSFQKFRDEQAFANQLERVWKFLAEVSEVLVLDIEPYFGMKIRSDETLPGWHIKWTDQNMIDCGNRLASLVGFSFKINLLKRMVGYVEEPNHDDTVPLPPVAMFMRSEEGMKSAGKSIVKAFETARKSIVNSGTTSVRTKGYTDKYIPDRNRAKDPYGRGMEQMLSIPSNDEEWENITNSPKRSDEYIRAIVEVFFAIQEANLASSCGDVAVSGRGY